MVTKRIYHCHTSYCGDCDVPVEESVKKAYEQGFATIGLSLHTPWPVDRPSRVSNKDFLRYIQEVAALQRKYKGKIEVLCGLEGEYDARYPEYFWSVRNAPGVDFVSFGLHYLDGTDGNVVVSRDNSAESVTLYVDLWIQAMETKMFLYAVHPEYFMLGYQDWDEVTIAASKRILDYAKKNDVVLGYDMKYFFRRPAHKSQGIPRKEFWQMALAMGIDIHVELDAHDTKGDWKEWIETGEKQLKELGCRRIVTGFDTKSGAREYGVL